MSAPARFERESHRPFLVEDVEPYALIPVDEGPSDYPEHYRDRVVITTVHDGAYIPPRFMERDVDTDLVQKFYEHERDWGAGLVAASLTQGLGLPSFSHVQVARVLMDFGRFPGLTPKKATHLSRFAISFPFSGFLDFTDKRTVLERYYDPISRHMDSLMTGGLVSISVHTYDTRNASGTVRPQISLVTRAAGYQVHSEMPIGVFDPLYPDILGEFTCDRILRDRISLNLEKDGIPVAHNYPYLLPEGSLEVRSQVWFFFDYLRTCFERDNPSTQGDPAYRAVWGLLLDTNLRSTESEALRSYIHMYRRPAAETEPSFAAARRAYEHVEQYLHDDRERIVDAYRFSPQRPSSLGIEVRKDLIWEFDKNERPIGPRREQAWQIGQCIARAVAQYLREDRVHPDAHFDLHRNEPWYTAAGPGKG